MKKDKVYLSKFFFSSLVKFLLIQILFIIVVFFYGGGGHGTYIPFAIFYGLFSIAFFINSNILTFFLGPIGFFIATTYIIGSKSQINFKILIFVYITSVMLGLLLTLPENVSIRIQNTGLIVSFVLSSLFWFLFYRLLKNKEQKRNKN